MDESGTYWDDVDVVLVVVRFRSPPASTGNGPPPPPPPPPPLPPPPPPTIEARRALFRLFMDLITSASNDCEDLAAMSFRDLRPTALSRPKKGPGGPPHATAESRRDSGLANWSTPPIDPPPPPGGIITPRPAMPRPRPPPRRTSDPPPLL